MRDARGQLLAALAPGARPGGGNHLGDAATGLDFADEFHSAIARWSMDLEQLSDTSALSDLGAMNSVFLDLTSAHPSGVAQLHAGHTTPLSNLIREPAALGQARVKARKLQADSQEFSLRYGLPSTQLAIATASWSEGDDDDETAWRKRTVPVLLRPVSLRHKAPGDQEIVLALEPGVEINPVLVAHLRGRGCEVDAAALAAGCFGGAGFNPDATLIRLRDLGQAVTRDFRLAERLVVGSFVRPGQVLAEDLVRHTDALRRHPVVRALAGDQKMAQRLRDAELPPLEAGDPAPWDERGIGDLEPSQHRLLKAAAQGSSLFVESAASAPVAATIAAMIADAAASGKSVLYVPGHQHAADAVTRQLAAHGLEELALPISPSAGWPEQALAALIEAAGLTVAPPDVDELAASQSVLAERSAQLTAYVTCMHQVREPWQVSAYQALQSLALATAAEPAPHTTVRISQEHCAQLTAQRRAECAAMLERLAYLGEFDGTFDTPWQSLADAERQDAGALSALVHHLSAQLLPAMSADIAEACAEAEVDEPRSVAAWGEMLATFARVRRTLEYFRPEVFERPATDMIDALAPSTWRREHGIETPASLRRLLRKQAKDLLRPGQAVADLHAALTEAEAARAEWQRLGPRSTWPKLPGALARMSATYSELNEALAGLEAVLGADPDGTTLAAMPAGQLQGRLERLWESRETLAAMPERAALLAGLHAAGLSGLVGDLRRRRPARGGSYADSGNITLLAAELELSWWLSVFESILASDPFLASCNGRSLQALLEEFEAFDRAHVETLPGLVGAAVSHWTRKTLAERPAEMHALMANAGGAPPDLTLAWQHAPHLVVRLRPCWLVGPLQITRAVPGQVGDHAPFDLVIADAVQTTQLAQLIPSLLRGGQVVAFGSERRALGRGAASALAAVLPHLELRASAGLRDPALSRFLIEFGGEKLQPPWPLPRSEQLTSLVLVDGTGMPSGPGGGVESTDAEIEAVVAALAHHVRERPGESLGVVAASQRHAERLGDAISAAAARDHEIRRALDQTGIEPLVVADLAALDGLVRDAIIFSVGYAKTPHGRLLHRFGRIEGPDGEALLLGALAAVRHRLTVFSCFGADELEPEKLRSDGARMLGAIIEFAGQGHEVVAQTQDPADTLLQDLAARLERRGLVVYPHYGLAAGQHLPLAVGHPATPDQLALAVLTDDAEFVAEPSNRVRTRLRRRELAALGWDVYVAWSIAAFLDPAEQVDQIERLVRRAAIAAGADPSALAGPLARRAAYEDVAGTLPDDDSALAGQETASMTAGGYDLPGPGMEADASGAEMEDEIMAEAGLPGDADLPAASAHDAGLTGQDARQETGLAAGAAPDDSAAPRRAREGGTEGSAPQREPVLPREAEADSAASWGEQGSGSGDDWLLQERPPHWHE